MNYYLGTYPKHYNKFDEKNNRLWKSKRIARNFRTFRF